MRRVASHEEEGHVSGDTTTRQVTPVILHGVASPERVRYTISGLRHTQGNVSDHDAGKPTCGRLFPPWLGGVGCGLVTRTCRALFFHIKYLKNRFTKFNSRINPSTHSLH